VFTTSYKAIVPPNLSPAIKEEKESSVKEQLGVVTTEDDTVAGIGG
jgi:hypothetical protein